MTTSRTVHCVLLGTTLAAALSTASNTWGQQRFRSSGKLPSEPAPTVELTMPTGEPSAGSALPPWQRPMHVPGVTPSAAAAPQSQTPVTAAAPDGLDIQIDLPDSADKARGDKHKPDLAGTDKGKADKAKADRAKSEKARADKARKPSSASRLAKSHAADPTDAKPGATAATGPSGAAASATKKPWLSGARRGPDDPESAGHRIRRARTEGRDRTAGLPPQASAHLR